MSRQMRGQVSRTFERFRANVTFERALARVDSVVPFQTTLSNEGQATYVTL